MMIVELLPHFFLSRVTLYHQGLVPTKGKADNSAPSGSAVNLCRTEAAGMPVTVNTPKFDSVPSYLPTATIPHMPHSTITASASITNTTTSQQSLSNASSNHNKSKTPTLMGHGGLPTSSSQPAPSPVQLTPSSKPSLPGTAPSSSVTSVSQARGKPPGSLMSGASSRTPGPSSRTPGPSAIAGSLQHGGKESSGKQMRTKEGVIDRYGLHCYYIESRMHVVYVTPILHVR